MKEDLAISFSYFTPDIIALSLSQRLSLVNIDDTAATSISSYARPITFLSIYYLYARTQAHATVWRKVEDLRFFGNFRPNLSY